MKSSKSNQPWYAAGDPWFLTQSEWSTEKSVYFETIFTQSNGYMGIRGYTEEANPGLKSFREGYLAGVFGEIDKAALKQVRVDYGWPMVAMITLPELFACEIKLEGETLNLAQGTIDFFSRSLNMYNGVLSRHVSWVSPTGLRTRLLFERFLSASNPHLAMQQITLMPENWNGKAVLTFKLDGAYPTYFRCGDRALPHPREDLLQRPKINMTSGGAADLTVRVRGTGHTVSIASHITGSPCVVSARNSTVLKQEVTLALEKRQSASVLHAVAVVSSRDRVEASRIPEVANDIARQAVKVGYHGSLTESETVWQKRWALADITIDGPARDQAYLRFGSFSMLQMAPFHTDNISVPARAYAFNRYHGLYYWDSETFLLPYYAHTFPEVAKNLLSFRYRTLPGAQRNARRLKAVGACFPWMTDSDDGTEQAPWSIGDYVWHQNADIAYAIDQYVQATGDTDFMRDKGLEILVETARFWMSRLEQDKAGVVHLHNTVGPDELDKHGKDNGYTSLMARRHLHLAAHWLKHLQATDAPAAKALTEKLEIGAGEAAKWTDAAQRIAAPMVPGRNFPLQDEFLLRKKPLEFKGITADEAFALRHTHRVVKQSDIILVMYLLQEEFTAEQMREAYDFYEPMTLHFSSLSYNTHSILATKIGRDQQAYDYFCRAAGLDLDDGRGTIDDGLHAAALGGTWQTLAYGFLGMRLLARAISFEPHLPEAWKSVSLRVAYRGYLLNLTLTHDGYRLDVEGEGQPQARVILNGETHLLRDELSAASAPLRVLS
ncbi:MAG TPA: glycosyl hydrolase family 65 protein [Verrucomicrobiae bacterium]|nr:glycosyl hydrolase family 65 protein [Verrucomicrobiae bacterium]